MATASSTRQTAEERREAILKAALVEFAEHGLSGASTDAIARAAGISQPYLFRLFGTKKELFIEAVRRCFASTLELFRQAAEGSSGEEALEAMGLAYVDMISNDPARLRLQMHAYVACEDAEIRAVVRKGFGEIVQEAEAISGLESVRILNFMARGMLLNVVASMKLLDASEPWARSLLDACRAHAV